MGATINAGEKLVADGRTARRERGRLAVIDAMLDLVLESGRPPSPATVATRAGVSAASLFRYFDTIDDLTNATAEAFYSRNANLFEIPNMGFGALDERISNYITTRLRLYETMSNMGRLVRFRAFDNEGAALVLREQRSWFVEQAQRHFAIELADLSRVEAAEVITIIATVTSFESWDQARHDHGQGPSQLKRAWSMALTRIFAR